MSEASSQTSVGEGENIGRVDDFAERNTTPTMIYPASLSISTGMKCCMHLMTTPAEPMKRIIVSVCIPDGSQIAFADVPGHRIKLLKCETGCVNAVPSFVFRLPLCSRESSCVVTKYLLYMQRSIIPLAGHGRGFVDGRGSIRTAEAEAVSPERASFDVCPVCPRICLCLQSCRSYGVSSTYVTF
jgi:hypothetical protein